MTTNEGKIKAFLNDEEKVRELANDGKFIEEVSGGTATPETYKKEFKKFDIELSDQDATQTKNVVDKVLEKSAEKLDDKFLKEISGGMPKAVKTAAGYAAAATLISGLGCSVATCVCAAKANEAKAAGNNAGYERYAKASQYCGIATAALVGTGLGALVLNNSPFSTYTRGYDRGFNRGYDKGYDNGYDKGQSDAVAD